MLLGYTEIQTTLHVMSVGLRGLSDSLFITVKNRPFNLMGEGVVYF